VISPYRVDDLRRYGTDHGKHHAGAVKCPRRRRTGRRLTRIVDKWHTAVRASRWAITGKVAALHRERDPTTGRNRRLSHKHCVAPDELAAALTENRQAPMTRTIGYRWRLREIMATRGLFATTNLQPLLAERGITLSASQVHRLVTGTPERLSLLMLAALCDLLDVTPNELIETHTEKSAPSHDSLTGPPR